MSLQQLRTFVEVHRQRSLTKAAARLALTQPAVSQQIASLEHQLGKRLFDRTRRGVVPTALADELAAALGASLDHAEAVLAKLRARSADLSGVIHLAGPAEYIGERLVDPFAKLAAAGIELRIRLGGRDAIYAHLLTGDVDLGVTASLPALRELESMLIGHERLVLIVPSSLDPPENPQTLIEEHPCCAYDADLPLIREWCAANDFESPRRSPAVVIPDLRTLLRFVAGGAGWTVLPDYIAASALADHTVRQGYREREQPENRLHLVWAKGRLRDPRVAHAKSLLLDGR